MSTDEQNRVSPDAPTTCVMSGQVMHWDDERWVHPSGKGCSLKHHLTANPVTAPDMVSVIAAALAEHQPAKGHRDLRPHCTCGEWVGSELAMFTELTAHQARAVAAATSEAGTVEWGVRVDQFVHQMPSEELARKAVGKFVGPTQVLVSRTNLRWERAE